MFPVTKRKFKGVTMLDGIRANAQSWGVKLAFSIIIVVFVFWGIGSYTGPKGVVATVNGDKITEIEFRRAQGQMEQNLRNAMPDVTPEMLQSLQLEQQVLQSLVVQKLIQAEAQRLGVDISPWELRRMVESLPYFLDKDGKFDPAVYLKTFEDTGRTVSQFETDLRNDMLPRKMEALVSAGAWASPAMSRALFDFQQEKRSMQYVLFPSALHTDKATPSPEEVQTAYAERASQYALPPRVRLEYVVLNPALMGDPASITDEAVAAAYAERQNRFATPEKVRARHILIAVPEKASEADVQSAQASLAAIEARIRGGEDFATVARESGQDGSAAQGGDLGWFTREQMVPEFAQAAFALKAGEMSGLVRSPFGFHLIKVEERQDEAVRALDEVREELRVTLAAEEASKTLQAKSDTLLAAALSGKDMATAITDAALKLEAVDSGLLSAEELASKLSLRPVDVQTIMNTPAATVLDTALAVPDGMLLVRVVESLPQMTRPLDEVREELVDALTRDKARKLALAEAQSARAKFTDAKLDPALTDRVQLSEAFGRDGYVPELGYDPAMVKALFAVPSAQTGEQSAWLETPFAVDEGAVLVRPMEIIAPSEEEWLAMAEPLNDNRTTNRASVLFQIYLMNLNKNADIRILEPSLFQRATPEA